MSVQKPKIAFVSYVRVIGALSVLVSHLVLMYFNNAASATFTYILPTTTEAPGWTTALAQWIAPLHFNFGAFGVSLFFLLSGFLIPLSLERASTSAFLKKRVLRIYPMYAIALTLTCLCIFIYTVLWQKTAYPHSFVQWLECVSLVRLLFWVPSIDGIEWTLEIEMAFYFFMAAASLFIKPKRPLFVACASLLLLLLSTLCNQVMQTNAAPELYPFLYMITHYSTFILYMLMGVSLYNGYAHYWKRSQCAVMLLFQGGLFALCILTNMYASDWAVYLTNYFLGFAVFVVLLALDRFMRGGGTDGRHSCRYELLLVSRAWRERLYAHVLFGSARGRPDAVHFDRGGGLLGWKLFAVSFLRKAA